MLTEEQLAARRAYIALLIQKAKEKALANPNALLFDPQGRVLIDVKLPEGAEELFKWGFTRDEEFNPSKVTTVSLDVTQDPELNGLKLKYMHQYGLGAESLRPLSKIQSSIIPLQQEYHFHLALASRTYGKVFEELFKKPWKKELEKALNAELETREKELDTEQLERDLYKEYEKQRAVEKKAQGKDFNPDEFRERFLAEHTKQRVEILERKKVKNEIIKKYSTQFKEEVTNERAKLEKQMAQAHQQAMIRLQPFIQDEFKKALAAARENGPLDEVRLIKELDKARERIFAEAHSILMEEVVKVTGKRLSRKDFEKVKVKHLAEATTATANDILHTDGTLQQATWISGTNNTAHERGIDTIADRQIVTIALDRDYVPSRLQIRTPSLDVKEDISKKAAIDDVSVKLTGLTAKYAIDKVVTGKKIDQDRPVIKAFTYNLHTAINDGLGDRNGNKQSEGARIILSGAHLYNKTQIQKSEEEEERIRKNIHLKKKGELSVENEEAQVIEVVPAANYSANPLCLVQNISVNGFGDSLGYGGDDLRTEATLMSEMAMLYNLVGENDTQIEKVKAVFDNYKEFLKNAFAHPEDDLFFSKSKEGKNAIKLIQEIKGAWKDRVVEVKADPVERANAALKTMMANDLHHQHEYSKLIQALSVFIEEASLSGCKSGNERAQAINGRVAILDHEAAHPPSHIFKIIDALALATPEQVLEQALSLKQQLDEKYDKSLQSGVSLVSDVDQGASAKVNAKKETDTRLSWGKRIKIFFSNMNRNNAEEPSLIHLSQSKPGDMQAHKELTKQMQESWEPKGFWKFLGKADVALSIVTFPLWLIKCAVEYGVYRHNSNSKERVNNALQEFDPEKPIEQLVGEKDPLVSVHGENDPELGGRVDPEPTIAQLPLQEPLSDWRKPSRSHTTDPLTHTSLQDTSEITTEARGKLDKVRQEKEGKYDPSSGKQSSLNIYNKPA
ncbi:TPA: hypothetical protein ACTXXA_002494 [Legionella anisa]